MVIGVVRAGAVAARGVEEGGGAIDARGSVDGEMTSGWTGGGAAPASKAAEVTLVEAAPVEAAVGEPARRQAVSAAALDAEATSTVAAEGSAAAREEISEIIVIVFFCRHRRFT